MKKEVEKVRELLNNKDNIESADDLREAFQQLQQRSLKLFELAYKKVNMSLSTSSIWYAGKIFEIRLTFPKQSFM